MSNFLVLDLKVIDSPQAGLGVARCLKALGHKVYGGDDTPFITSSDLFEKTFVIDEIRTLNLDSLLKKLINLRDLYEIEYIVPCYDETVILFSYLRDKIEFLGLKLLAPSIKVIKSLRKENLEHIFNSGKFTTPQTAIISSFSEAEDYANSFGYPVFVKGLTKAAIQAKDAQELKNAISQICNIWNNGEIHCLIQKKITGKFINILLAYTGQRITSYIEMEKVGLDSNGATWFGKLTTERSLFNEALTFCKRNEIGDCILEIETIQTENGNYFVYEVNYRPPAWIYANALNGQNFLQLYLTPETETVFNNTEAYFGRETIDFVRKLDDISQYTNLQYFSKGAAYKNNNQNYPSELML